MSQQLTSQSFTASLRFLACDSGITILLDVTMRQVKISLRKEVAIVFPGFDVGGLGTVHGEREAQSLESEAAVTTLYQQPGKKMMLSLGHQLTFLFHGRLEQVPDHEYNFQLGISRNTSYRLPRGLCVSDCLSHSLTVKSHQGSYIKHLTHCPSHLSSSWPSSASIRKGLILLDSGSMSHLPDGCSKL